jgi:DNA polymerase-3 subunit epsilon
MFILTFDTETTGLCPKVKDVNEQNVHEFPYIVQLSFVVYDTELNQTVLTMDRVIRMRDGVIIGDESISFHGITNERSRDEGIDIVDALREFTDAASTVDMVIAHNLEFDLKMIYIERLRHGVNPVLPDNVKLHCTMKDQTSIDLCKLPSKYRRGYKYPTLTELHQKLFEEPPANAHNSLYDVLATQRCYLKMYHTPAVCAE